MHDLKKLRKNLENFKKKLSHRNIDFKIDLFETLDNNNRKLISEKEKLEHDRKLLSKSKEKLNFEKSKKISQEILKISKEQVSIQKKLDELLHFLPNLALDEVPIGKDEKFNKLINKFGDIKNLLLNLNHIDIGLKDNEIDFDTSIKLSGSRFVVLRNKIALLERALINFMLDIHTNDFKYTEISSSYR